MALALSDDEVNQLQRLIEKTSVLEVLISLAMVCEEKAEQILDKDMAFEWRQAARRINLAASEIHGLRC